MIALLTMILTAAAACASAENHALLRAEVGYDGTMFDGRWCPLEVTVRATGDDVSGVLAVDIGQNYAEFDRLELPVSVKSGETEVFHLSILPLTSQRTFSITLTDDGGGELGSCTATAKKAVSQWSSIVMGVLSDDDTLAEAMAVSQENDELGREEIIEPVRLNAQTVAQDARELDAFDVLAIDGFDVGSLSEAQQQMLLRWVKDGGVVLLGTGRAGENSLAWFEALTGVRPARTAEELPGVVPALMAYAKATSEAEDDALTAVYPLSAGESRVLAAIGESKLLAASECGDGLVMTCAFSLADESVKRAAKQETLWQRMLIACDKEWYNDALKNYSYSNYTIYESLTDTQRVSEGNGILPVVVFLAAYVIVVGVGLYVLMKRLDRSKELWLVIPVASIVCAGIVVLLGGQLGLKAPAAASVHITLYDRQDRATTEECVSISYAGQDRAVITAADGSAVERRSNGYFTSTDRSGDMTLRDTIRLGDAPSIELCGQATWLMRNLMVKTDRAPQGSIKADVYMDADGLHVAIENGMDTDLEDAVLLTSLGYATLGSIRAGEKVTAQLTRTERAEIDAQSNLIIPEGVMLPMNADAYEVIDACVYPEKATQPGFAQSSLSEVERYRREMEERRLGIACYGSEGFSGVLTARTPQIPCTQLLLDGEPITRTAQSSMVIKQIAMDVHGENGYYYVPQGVIPAYLSTCGGDERPQMGKEQGEEYVEVRQGMCFGYTIEDVPLDKLTQIRIVVKRYYRARPISLEVYDHVLGTWVTLGSEICETIDGKLLTHAVSGEGKLFLRCGVEVNDGVYVPEIIVEGSDEA